MEDSIEVPNRLYQNAPGDAIIEPTDDKIRIFWCHDTVSD
jgi:hypothetical protein